MADVDMKGRGVGPDEVTTPGTPLPKRRGAPTKKDKVERAAVLIKAAETVVDPLTISKPGEPAVNVAAIVKSEPLPVTSAEAADVIRQSTAVKLRISGLSYGDIAQQLHCSDLEAKKCVETTLALVRDKLLEDVADLRVLEAARLDALMGGLWDNRQDPVVVDRILKIMDRRAKMLGLDAPSKLEVADKTMEAMTDEQLKERVKMLLDTGAAAGVGATGEGAAAATTTTRAFAVGLEVSTTNLLHPKPSEEESGPVYEAKWKELGDGAVPVPGGAGEPRRVAALYGVDPRFCAANHVEGRVEGAEQATGARRAVPRERPDGDAAE